GDSYEVTTYVIKVLEDSVVMTVFTFSSTLASDSFFFQAEDGIRDATVTGVQTCALPISSELCNSLRAAGTRGSILTSSGWRETCPPAFSRTSYLPGSTSGPCGASGVEPTIAAIG